MTDPDRIVAELRAIVEAHADTPYGPIGEAMVADAERALGLTFPPSYRLFLREFGGVTWIVGQDLHGLPEGGGPDDDPPYFRNVVDRTNWLREWVGRDHGIRFWTLRNSLIEIGSDAGGDCWNYYLDRSRVDADGESPVLIWMPGYYLLQDFAPSFLAFLRRFRDEMEPYAGLIAEIRRHRCEQVLDLWSRPGLIPAGGRDVPAGLPVRRLLWFRVEIDPGLAILRENALLLGVEVESGTCFLLAEGLPLDADERERADAAGGSVLSERAERLGRFVALDYLEQHHPGVFEVYELDDLRRRFRDSADRYWPDEDQ